MDCVTLWIGDRLGPVERACLRSVLRQGHSVALYCYQKPDGVPDGVELRAAAEILPESCVFRHKSGSFAPYSDWFRYELQKRGAGIWIDTDVYLIAPLPQDSPYLFGEESPGFFNNAVLRMPAESAALSMLLDVFDRGKASWIPRVPYWKFRVRKWITGSSDASRLPWAMTGPKALTAVAKSLDLTHCAVPREVFYPVHWERAGWVLDPALAIQDVVTGSTVGIHLWNEIIKRFKEEPAPAGSFLSRLHEEGA